jgi:hypothetical protein
MRPVPPACRGRCWIRIWICWRFSWRALWKLLYFIDACNSGLSSYINLPATFMRRARSSHEIPPTGCQSVTFSRERFKQPGSISACLFCASFIRSGDKPIPSLRRSFSEYHSKINIFYFQYSIYLIFCKYSLSLL